jgi:hypothetical protein
LVISLTASIASSPLGQDVRRAECPREVLAGAVAAEDDDPLGAQARRSDQPR